MSLLPLAALAARAPNAPFLVGPDRSWSVSDSWAEVQRLAKGLPRCSVSGARDGVELVHLMLAAAEANAVLALTPGPFPERVEAHEASLVLFSSGTTGTPRPVVHPWRELLRRAVTRDQLHGARWLLLFRLHHFAGVQMVAHVLANEGVLVIPERLTGEAARRALVEQAVTHVSATPTFWRLYGAAHVHEAPVAGVRQVTVGGEAASDEGLSALRRQFPSAQVSHVYATTELGTCFSVSDGRAGFPSAWLDDAVRRLGLRIVEGELQVRRQEPGAPPGPWGATGDLVERVGERVFFRGRVTELINVGGVKVAPLVVEEVLLRVPGVLHARVWGKPNPVTGQLVAASLVLAPPATRETVEPLLRAAVLSLPRVQQPRHLEFVDVLPEVNLKLSRRTPGESP